MSLERDFIYGMYEARGRDDKSPITYLVHDISYRCPWLFGPMEPPWTVLFPVVRTVRTARGKRVVRLDPYTVFIGMTESGIPFAYNPRYVVNPLLFIVGTPGAGKSATVHTIIYNMILQLLANEELHEVRVQRPTIIVVDPEGEYEKLADMIGRPEETLILKLGRGDYINIFDRPSKSINPANWYMRILPVLQKFMNISQQQAPRAYRVLLLAINSLLKKRHVSPTDPRTWVAPDITLAEIFNEIEENYIHKYESTEKKMTRREKILYGGAETLYSRLKTWMNPPNDAFSHESSIPLHNIFRYRLVILDLRSVSSMLRGLFSYWITMWVYGLMLEKGPLPEFGIRVALVIDEAWALLKKQEEKQENPLEEMARRCRKYGILLIVSTQTPEDVSEKMFTLFGTLACGRVPSSKMVDKIAASRGMPDKYKKKLANLQQGDFVWSIIWRRTDFPNAKMPVMVHTEYVIPPLVEIEI